MAEFDPNTVTVGDLARIYSEEQGLKTPLSLGTILGPYKDQPAMAFFAESEGEISIARQAMKDAQGTATDNALKGALKNLRYLSNRLYNSYDTNPPPYLISNEKNTPKVAQEFFGVKEPPKAVSTIQVNTDPEVRKQYVQELMDYAANNPDKKPHVRAILFGLNTGFRPNANVGVTTGQYIPSKGALYIRPDVTGAKGRAISVPLNDIADSMLQQQLTDYKDAISETGKIWVDAEGKPLKTADINSVLEQIKVPNLLYDEKTGEYFDSFKPEGTDSSKFGMSLFRNYHTAVGRKIGMNDLILAKLQGRSTKSYGKGSTGELSTYDSNFPGDVSDYEREQANMLAGEYGPDIETAKKNTRSLIDPTFDFDWGGDYDTVKTRITERTEGFGSDYFKREVVAPSETATAAPKAPKGLTEEDKAGVLKRLTDWSKGALDSPTTKAIAGIGLTGMGISAAQRLEAAEERVAAGEGEMPAYLKEGARFVAEEFTPAGFVEPAKEVIGAGLKAGAEAAQKEAEEKGISGDIEAQIRSVLGVPPQF